MDNIMKKIANLLSLSGDTSDEEGQTALDKARLLMMKHNLDMMDIEGYTMTSSDVVEMSLYDTYRTIRRWEYELIDLVADMFRCRVYYKCIPRQRKPIFVGLKDDVSVAINTYTLVKTLLLDCRNRYVSDNYHRHLLTKYEVSLLYRSYSYGFIRGASRKIKDTNEEMMRKSHGKYELVLQVPVVVNEFLGSKKFSGTISTSMSSSDLHHKSIVAGESKGYEIDYTKSTIDSMDI